VFKIISKPALLSIKSVFCLSAILCLALSNSSSAQAQTNQNQTANRLTIACATNFSHSLDKLISAYQVQKPNLQIQTVYASSGKLFSQIHYGAPFDIFLSADSKKPERLLELGLAENNHVSTYAIGQLALWHNIKHSEETVRLSHIIEQAKRISIANPKHAPYGIASLEVLEGKNLLSAHQSKLVYAENVAQALQFKQSQNVDSAFIARSHAKFLNIAKSQIFLIPNKWHAPIEQKMLVLKHSNNKQPALDFYRFLLSPEAKKIIQADEYL